MKKIDIYTKEIIKHCSDEHILLNALGGRWTSQQLVDRDTNSEFGRTIDTSLSESMHLFRILIDAPAGDGTPVPLLKSIQGKDGETYNLLPGGKPQLGKSRIYFYKSQDGTTLVEGRARSLSELKKLLKRKLEQLSTNPSEIIQKAQPMSTPTPELSGKFKLGIEAYRCIAKMSCNLFAIHNKEIFLEKGFDDIRDFVLGKSDRLAKVWLNTDDMDIQSNNGGLGEVDHLLLVRALDSGSVKGFIALFRFFQFIIDLGETDSLTSGTWTYRVDQTTGHSQINNELDLSLNVSAFDRERPQLEQEKKAIKHAFDSIQPYISELQLERARHRIVDEAYNEVFANKPKGDPITKDEAIRFANLISSKWIVFQNKYGLLSE